MKIGKCPGVSFEKAPWTALCGSFEKLLSLDCPVWVFVGFPFIPYPSLFEKLALVGFPMWPLVSFVIVALSPHLLWIHMAPSLKAVLRDSLSCYKGLGK